MKPKQEIGESVESETANTPVNSRIRSGPRRFFRGCAIGCLLPLILVVGVGWIVLLILKHPKLNAVHVLRVDVTLRKEQQPYTNYLGAITNAVDLKRLFSVMANSSSSALDHKCAEVGWFNIRYDNGKVRRINFLPGHHVENYEYRPGFGVRQMDRAEFFRVLSNAGIQTNDFAPPDE